jgi:hypothetical protein
MSSITRVLHTTTWGYFTSYLPQRFGRSPIVVKEAIMMDINDLLQKFSRTSIDEAPFFAMHRLLAILRKCSDKFDVCFDIVFVLRLPSTYLIKSTDVPTAAIFHEVGLKPPIQRQIYEDV